MEVELVVASADDHLATLLWEVGHAGIELDVAVIFQSLAKTNELQEMMTGFGGNVWEQVQQLFDMLGSHQPPAPTASF